MLRTTFLCSTGDHLFNSLLCSCSVDCAVAAGNNIALVKVLQIRFFVFQLFSLASSLCVCVCVSGRSVLTALKCSSGRERFYPRVACHCTGCLCARARVCLGFFPSFTVHSLGCRHYSALTLHDQIMSAKLYVFFFLCILLFVYASCSYLPSPYLTPSPSMPLESSE